MAVLDPDHRKLLSQALRPPLGFAFDQALATTYTLDLTTLLTVPLHLAQFAAESQGEALRDGIALLESLQRASKRLSIWCQAGRIAAPGMPHILYSLLEPVVVPVRAPRGGVFHPKLWLLRFAAQGQAARLRLLVLSRNLTPDRSWDTALWLDGEVGTRDRASNRPLVDLLQALPGLAVGDVAESVQTRTADMAKDLRRAEWELPEGYDTLAFDVLGFKKQKWLPPESDQMVIVSPFLGAEALTAALQRARGKAIGLVSRSEALDALPADLLCRFGAVKVLAEAAETESGYDDAGHAEDDDGVIDAPIAGVDKPMQDQSLHGLHAKICMMKSGWDTAVVVGSANATNAAWLAGSNVEFIATLQGKSSKVGRVEEFLGPEGFGQVLVDYRRAEGLPAVDPALVAAEEALESARKALADARLRLDCVGADDTWSLTLGSLQPVDLAGISSCRAWLVSLKSQTAVDAAGLALGLPVTLTTAPLAAVTGLVAFELHASAADQRVRFVLNLPIQGLPAERDAALVRAIVLNRDGFLRYLLMLLGGDHALLAPDGGSGGEAMVWRGGTGGLDDQMPLLEQLTRAWARGRVEELQSIDRLVRDLQKADGGGDVLPSEFLAVWGTFREALGTTPTGGA